MVLSFVAVLSKPIKVQSNLLDATNTVVVVVHLIVIKVTDVEIVVYLGIRVLYLIKHNNCNN